MFIRMLCVGGSYSHGAGDGTQDKQEDDWNKETKRSRATQEITTSKYFTVSKDIICLFKCMYVYYLLGKQYTLIMFCLSVLSVFCLYYPWTVDKMLHLAVMLERVFTKVSYIHSQK